LNIVTLLDDVPVKNLRGWEKNFRLTTD